jgi:AraC-like DNA-binding protein
VPLQKVAKEFFISAKLFRDDVGFARIRAMRAALPVDPKRAVDVDDVPRPITAFLSAASSKAWENVAHRHAKAQLLYTVRGVITCQVGEAIWIVPPQCAVWIPGGLLHRAYGSGQTECYCLFVSPNASKDLPRQVCILSVTPLLRELLIRAVSLKGLYALKGPEGRLVATLLDELIAAPVEDLHWPVPNDARLKKLARLLLANPAAKTTLALWARRVGMSERSLSRVLMDEVGMSFGDWRRQLHVIISLQRLSKGERVQRVALDLGYESASGFVTMFRKLIGQPPAQFIMSLNRAAAADRQRPDQPHAIPISDAS